MSYNLDLIAQFSLLFSFVGLVQMALSKMSILSGLPETTQTKEENKFFVEIKRKVVDENPLKEVNYDRLLSKILKGIRLFFLKADNKLFGWTRKLKENSQKKKIEEEGDYWDKVKKNTR